MDASERLFEARLTEYVSIREEVLGSIGNQHTTLTFGTALLAAVFGAGLATWKLGVAPAIFFAVLPLSWWILAMWLGEVVRMLRASAFCSHQEELLNGMAAGSSSEETSYLHWEHWRRQGKRTTLWTYLSVGLFVLTTNLAALTCACVTAAHDDWSPWVLGAALLVSVASGLAFAYWVLSVFRAWTAQDIGMRPTFFTRPFEAS